MFDVVVPMFGEGFPTFGEDLPRLEKSLQYLVWFFHVWSRALPCLVWCFFFHSVVIRYYILSNNYAQVVYISKVSPHSVGQWRS